MPTQEWERKATQTMSRIEESAEINDRNTELIREYKRDQVLKGLSQATLSRNLTRLKILAEHLGDRSFDDLDRAGVKDMVEWLYEQDYTDGTIDTYKNVIRSFYRWHEPTDDGKTPPKAAWIKMKATNGGNGTLPKDLLTKEDVREQIEAANNDRDKALIAILYETGARIGELIDLTVGDIEDRKHGKKIVINGKTGARRLPLVESVPHLNRWLNNHPKPEKDAPLWCKLQQNGPTEHLNPDDVEDIEDIHGIGSAIAPRLRERGIETARDLLEHSPAELAVIDGITEAGAEKWFHQFDAEHEFNTEDQLTYKYITEKILKKTMDAAGIDKPANPHHYRHSRASFLANELKEAQLCEWFGWVQGSDVPAKYVHLSGRDIDNAYDQLHGLYEPEEEGDGPDVIECPRCEELNDPKATFCMRCGFGIDPEKAVEFEEETDDKVKESYKESDPEDTETHEELEAIEDVLEDPEVKELLRRKMQEAG